MNRKINLFVPLILIFNLSFGQENTDYLKAFSDTIQTHMDVYQCDSLIQANALNPDFVILDVRTPEQHFPDHLEGAILRDYLDPIFNLMINALPRHKFYIIHCRSGGKSANTFNMMKGLDFTRIVNMLGGINAWKSVGFPTTSEFAPLLMAVSDTIIDNDTIPLGAIDTRGQMGIDKEQISIFDSRGFQVYQKESETSEGIMRIDLSSIPPGTYILRIKTFKKADALKFVKY
jgi:rhodanese-related sulfurtransferase